MTMNLLNTLFSNTVRKKKLPTSTRNQQLHINVVPVRYHKKKSYWFTLPKIHSIQLDEKEVFDKVKYVHTEGWNISPSYEDPRLTTSEKNSRNPMI